MAHKNRPRMWRRKQQSQDPYSNRAMKSRGMFKVKNKNKEHKKLNEWTFHHTKEKSW